MSLIGRVEDDLACQDLEGAEQDFAEFAHRLKRHMEVEDEILYPAVEHAGSPLDISDPTRRLRAEHEQIRGSLDVIGDHLASVDDFTPDELVALLDKLAEHICYEESLVYPACDRVLEETVRVRAVRELVRKGGGSS
jgi:hemerythrin-like domain-containing protein